MRLSAEQVEQIECDEVRTLCRAAVHNGLAVLSNPEAGTYTITRHPNWVYENTYLAVYADGRRAIVFYGDRSSWNRIAPDLALTLVESAPTLDVMGV